MVGVQVLRKTNERLYSEMTALQNQLKKLESMNSSSLSMVNSGLQFNPSASLTKKSMRIPDERSHQAHGSGRDGLDLMNQLDKL